MSVFANVIAPTAYFWPGILPMMLGMALPATVLAAVIERPFVTRAGVTKHALWYSLQANLMSLAIGYALMPVAAEAIYSIGPLWSLIAVAISIVSETVYYRQWWVPKAELDWRWVATGNVVSSVVLLLLPVIALQIKYDLPSAERMLDPYQGALFWGSVSVSVAVFAISIFMPGIIRGWRARASVVGPAAQTTNAGESRRHSAFLNGYAPEDEGIYDDIAR
jgi:hypothetical protein